MCIAGRRSGEWRWDGGPMGDRHPEARIPLPMQRLEAWTIIRIPAPDAQYEAEKAAWHDAHGAAYLDALRTEDMVTRHAMFAVIPMEPSCPQAVYEVDSENKLLRFRGVLAPRARWSPTLVAQHTTHDARED